jgi:predicted metal-dependent peptidase
MYNFPANLSAEQYYFLLKEKHEEEQKDQEDQDDSDGSGGSGGDDSDEEQDNQNEQSGSGGDDSDEEQGSSGGQGTGKFKDGTPDPFQDNGDGDGNGFDEHDWESAKEVDEELLNDVTSNMIEKSISKSKGYTPSQLDEFLKLCSNKAVVNWRQVLRKYTGKKRANTRQTIKKRNRRFPGRPEVKGKTKDYTYEVAVIADVSGSVTDEELYKGLSEIQEICRLTDSDLTLVQVDSEAYEPEKFSAKQTTWKRKASGGTVLYPGVEKLKEHKVNYDVLIVITDNGVWGDDIDNFNSHKKPTMWLSTQEGTLDLDSHIRQFYIGE